jgi:HEAT repeat protein
VRQAALEVVAARHLNDDLPQILSALEDEHPAVKAQAARALGTYRQNPLGQHLMPLLDDPHPHVRAVAAAALGQLPSVEFSPALEKCLSDPDSEVRYQAAQALARVGRSECVEGLRGMAEQDPRLENRRAARLAEDAVSRRTAPSAETRRQERAGLAAILVDPRSTPEQRQRAKTALLRLGGRESIPILMDALKTTHDFDLHYQIVEILVALPPGKELQTALLTCARHISPPIRELALQTLGRVADRDAIYFLNEFARETTQPGHYLTEEDSRLALEAVDEIQRRSGRI